MSGRPGLDRNHNELRVRRAELLDRLALRFNFLDRVNQSRLGSAAPACSRERSSRFSTRRERRSPSPTTASLSSARSASRQRWRVERGAGGDHRGQRRPQVVGDRAQQRGLQLVAAAQRLGLDHLAPASARARASQRFELGPGAGRPPRARARPPRRAAGPRARPATEATTARSPGRRRAPPSSHSRRS